MDPSRYDNLLSQLAKQPSWTDRNERVRLSCFGLVDADRS